MRSAAYILSVKLMNIVFRNKKAVLLTLIAGAGIPCALIFSEACAAGIRGGIALCSGILVPSLFVFMVLTAYLIKSGGADVIARPFGWLARMMRLPDEAAAAILLSMIGGYPIGAGCVALLYEQGQLSSSEAQKTACIAVAAGPGFVVSFVGRGLLNNMTAGNILLLAQIAAVVLTGVIAGRMIPCSPPPRRRRLTAGGSGALVAAVRSAADATFAMCAMVVLFSAVIEVVSTAAGSRTADALCAVLEITAGCSRLSARVPLYVTAFFIGFGGLSVHFQIFAALGELRVKLLPFFLCRIAQGIIAMAAAYIFLMITPMQSAVFSSSDVPVNAARSATYAGSGALILAALCFVGSISSKLRRMKVCAE